MILIALKRIDKITFTFSVKNLSNMYYLVVTGSTICPANKGQWVRFPSCAVITATVDHLTVFEPI